MGHAALGLAIPTPQACLNFVPSRPRAWQLPGTGTVAGQQLRKLNLTQPKLSSLPPLPSRWSPAHRCAHTRLPHVSPWEGRREEDGAPCLP